jgi:hypothetical protein
MLKKYKTLSNVKPGYMYDYNGTIICFLGDTNSGSDFPKLCLIFSHKNVWNSDFYFIEWSPSVIFNFIPLNKRLKEYIIENKIIKKTLESFEKHHFASGPDLKGDSLKIIKKFKEKLIKDPVINLEINIQKYNL